MAKKRPTKAERDHMGRVAELGCIACLNMGYRDTPAEVHHIRAGAGGAQRSSHTEVLPLCPMHHRIGGYQVAIHAGQVAWEARHGKERKLLKQVEGLLNERA